MSVVLSNPASIDDMPGPKGLPVVGNFFAVKLDRLHLKLEEWAAEFGPIYQFSLGPVKMVVVSDFDTVTMLHRERPDIFTRSVRVESVLSELGINGVFSAEGDNWRRQRKIVATALNTAHLKGFYPNMKRSTDRLRGRWEKAADADRKVDLCADLMRYTVDITTEVAFGIDFNTIETDGPVIQQHLDKILPLVNTRINAPIQYWKYFKFAKDKAVDRALAELKHQIDDIIRQTRQRMAANADLYKQPTNFLEALIAAKEEEQIEFSDSDVFGNVFTLLLAGEDTTANTIAWAIKLFIDHPAEFARAREEVDQVLGDESVPSDIDSLGELKFVEAFANEVMRFKPVAPINGMDPIDDVELMGYRIPGGTPIMVVTRFLGKRAENFGRPEEFDPDRWLVEQPVAGCPHNTRAYLPFGTGPRFCPGRNLALAEIKAVLAMFIKNFDARLADPARAVEERLAFTMMPINLDVRFSRR